MTLIRAFSFVVLATFVSGGNALACKCAKETQDLGYAAKSSPLIFSGQLISVTDVEKSGAAGTYPIRVFKFVPYKIWRGTKVDTITLVSGNNNCDVMLANGRYVIYTNPARDLTSCNRIIQNSVEAETRKLDQLFTRTRFKKLQVPG